MKQPFLRVCLLLGFAAIASAHFVFVVPLSGGSTAQVFISETLQPTDEVDAGLVSGAKLSLRDSQGHETPLTLVRGDHAFLTALPSGGTRIIHGLAEAIVGRSHDSIGPVTHQLPGAAIAVAKSRFEHPVQAPPRFGQQTIREHRVFAVLPETVCQ